MKFKIFLSIIFLSIFLVACTNPNDTQQTIDKMNGVIDPVVKNLNKETLLKKYNEIQSKISSTQKTLNEKKNEAETKAKELEIALNDAKQNTEEKINDIKKKVEQAKKAYEDAKNALETLNKAAGDLKSSLNSK